MRLIFLIISILSLSSFFASCKSTPSCLTVVPPEINLTGEKTVIERQIVGDYKELEKDAWIISSVNKNTSSAGQSSANTTIIEAIKKREANSKKIRQYKDQGALGEKSDGFIAYIENALYEKSPEQKTELLAIIEEENNARNEIFIKTLAKNKGKNPTKEEIAEFGKTFAEEQKSLALKGDWIQDKNGKWSRKK